MTNDPSTKVVFKLGGATVESQYFRDAKAAEKWAEENATENYKLKK